MALMMSFIETAVAYAGRGHDIFLDHSRTEVIRAETECYLSQLQALSYP